MFKLLLYFYTKSANKNFSTLKKNHNALFSSTGVLWTKLNGAINMRICSISTSAN